MSKKVRRIRVKPKRRKYVPGSSPGLLDISTEALAPKIYVYSYNEPRFEVVEVSNYPQLKEVLNKKPDLTHWVDVRGLNDIALLQSLQTDFGINLLVLEDVVNGFQRPKLEEYETYCFAVSRMLCLNEDLQVENEQMSFILTNKNILFTFQENYTDCLGPVRSRLQAGKGLIRTGGASYMMYALMDIILDNYFALLNRFAEDLDALEDRLYRTADKNILFEIQQVKRVFSVVRRSVWPERDKLNDMLRSPSELISDETKLYIRDAYDHSIQIIDLVENYKEISSGLMDTYLSITSNRMNNIMKVLTIISAIFIPLTFIAGVYGMNFAHQDPDTGKILYKNMPELYSDNGYIYTLAAMLAIGILQLIIFWRKGWLK